mmetsp:Transcript_43972/g.77556  ORF Transcript_43972/g.77556 Transcript_43972/m.77556 type:complete len:164 (-) Transcript_43972:668-1159(-)
MQLPHPSSGWPGPTSLNVGANRMASAASKSALHDEVDAAGCFQLGPDLSHGQARTTLQVLQQLGSRMIHLANALVLIADHDGAVKELQHQLASHCRHAPADRGAAAHLLARRERNEHVLFTGAQLAVPTFGTAFALFSQELISHTTCPSRQRSSTWFFRACAR